MPSLDLSSTCGICSLVVGACSCRPMYGRAAVCGPYYIIAGKGVLCCSNVCLTFFFFAVVYPIVVLVWVILSGRGFATIIWLSWQMLCCYHCASLPWQMLCRPWSLLWRILCCHDRWPLLWRMLLPPMLRWPLLWWMLCCQCRLFSLFISSECFVATIVGGGSSHISSGVDALPPWMCFSIGNYCIDDISFSRKFILLGFGGWGSYFLAFFLLV